MIPEAAGATPEGIYQLADEYRSAAGLALASQPVIACGPTRLLCYHAMELYLKAYLWACAEDIPTLRAYGHNLDAMMQSAQTHGLQATTTLLTGLHRVTEANDYVRVRYMVVEKPTDLPLTHVLNLTNNMRNVVRKALRLNKNGKPILPVTTRQADRTATRAPKRPTTAGQAHARAEDKASVAG